MGFAKCNKICIPNYLRWNGITIMVFPSNGYVLYRRFRKEGQSIEEWKDIDKQDVLADVIPLDMDSYNRSDISQDKEDVLLSDCECNCKKKRFNNFGILSVKIEDVNGVNIGVEVNDIEQNISINLIHTPKDCNFSHCEMELFDKIQNIKFEPANYTKAFLSAVRVELIGKYDMLKPRVIKPTS